MNFEKFEKLREEQKSSILKWRDLEQGKIVEIKGFKCIATRFDDSACVIELADGREFWATSTLQKDLKKGRGKFRHSRCYMVSNGLVESKKNAGQTYYSVDIVWEPKEESEEESRVYFGSDEEEDWDA